MPFVGLSSSYFGFKGLSIYDSVKKVHELGFSTVELGAGHAFEKNVWNTIKKIKKDFPEMNFTVHGLFPPLEERYWFNVSLGLTEKNKKVIDAFFKAASILEAKLFSFHPGFLAKVGFGEEQKEQSGMVLPKPIGQIPKEKGMQNLFAVLDYAVKKSNENGIGFAIENLADLKTNALVSMPKDFAAVFSKFPAVGLLFDSGHAMVAGNFKEFLEQFNERIMQLHLSYNHGKGIDEHLAFPKEFDFSFLKKIKQLKKIPIIFEHGLNVTEQQIIKEKELLEKYLENI